MKLKQALAQKGLAKESIEAAIDRCDCDWLEMCKTKALENMAYPLQIITKNNRVGFFILLVNALV